MVLPMQIYRAPVSEYMKLKKVFDIQHEHYDDATIQAVLENAAKFAENELLSCNKTGDQEGCHLNVSDNTVTLPKDFHKVYTQYVTQGWAALGGKQAYGGSEMPLYTVLAVVEFMAATNMSFTIGPMLTPAACQVIDYAGTQAQKDTYLTKLTTGEYSGTMCLTEAHCGTDLGLIKTKATESNGHYRITGNKIWITYGEHELSKNIIHLVLAKLPGAPKGSRGISMFIVPKYLEDGTRNSVKCTGLESKMGQHAAPTCFMSFEDAEGYLLGEPNQGLKNMFLMMNEARIGVGHTALALSDIAYQTARAFVRERNQSRALDPNKRNTEQEADNILVHPDIRRQLLEVKSTNLAMRALVVYTAKLQSSETAADQARVALLIPIIKAYLSGRGVQNIDTCMQILGGSGYVRDWCIEQYFRDARISMIYEGTNGIQALDLVGRKLMLDQGNSIKSLIADMHKCAKLCESNIFSQDLEDITCDLQQATMWLAKNGIKDHEQAAAVANDYLHLCAIALLAMMWLTMLESDQDYDEHVARYFFKRVLVQRHTLMQQITAGKSSMVDLDDSSFD